MFKKLKIKFIAWLTSGQDLIYTSKGNIPVKDLVRKLEWQFSESGICLKETYLLNGEMVKEGADVFQLPLGTTLKLEQGNL
jgi:hypothetical protein